MKEDEYNAESFRERLLFTADQWINGVDQMTKFQMYVELNDGVFCWFISVGCTMTLHSPSYPSSEHPGKFIVVRFEDLMDKTKQRDVIANVITFLGIQVDARRLQCAFEKVEDPRIHRPKIVADNMMTKEKAYANKQLVCDTWTIISRGADTFGYRPFGDVNCDQIGRSEAL